jgi:hypothetical protein
VRSPGLVLRVRPAAGHLMKMLTHAQARSFYDRLGAKQDRQRFFEDPATRDLVTRFGIPSEVAVAEALSD